VGCIGYHLSQSFVRPAITVIKHHCENNGNRKSGKKSVEIDKDGVPNNIPAPMIVKEFFKVIKTNPGASQNTPGNHKTSKGYLGPIHGEVVKYKNKNKRNKNKEIQFPVPLKLFSPVLPFHI
jgi:hypothetical protein